jgi:ABC-type nitrate/sulfonate/bicarbonate transport system permease component
MTERAGGRRGKTSPKLTFAIFFVSFALFLLAWYAAAAAVNNTLILARPAQVLNAFTALLHNELPRGAPKSASVYSLVVQTIGIVVAGFGLSVLVGVPLGIAMGRWRIVESVVDPWVNATYSIPVVALIPVLYFAIGTQLEADVFMAFLLSIPTIIVSTHSGVRYVSNSLAEVGRSFGASGRGLVTKIVLPASLPEIFAGMRVGVGRALLGAIMAEALLSKDGLGGMMMSFQSLFNTPYMMASVVLVALIGISLLQAPGILEGWLFPWRDAGKSSGGTKA